MATFTILCSGPGPHSVPGGVLGTSDRPVTGMFCGATACVPTLDSTGTNANTLRDRAQAALAANATFLGVASPTTAQAVAQVQTLTKECSALIRLLLSQFDSTSGT